MEITKNPKYQKLNSLVEDKVLLADVVSKINRANGKVSTVSSVSRVDLYLIKSASFVIWSINCL